MNDHLKQLVELSRKTEMTPIQREEQRRSFAYGNTHFENPLITREMVDREAERMQRAKENSELSDKH
jgi:hypothetical protein